MVSSAHCCLCLLPASMSRPVQPVLCQSVWPRPVASMWPVCPCDQLLGAMKPGHQLSTAWSDQLRDEPDHWLPLYFTRWLETPTTSGSQIFKVIFQISRSHRPKNFQSIQGFWPFYGEYMAGMAWNLVCRCFLTTFTQNWLDFGHTVDFPNLGSILTQWNRSNLGILGISLRTNGRNGLKFVGGDVAISVYDWFDWWQFHFMGILVCDSFSLWPFRSVASSVCGRCSL